MLLRRCSRGLSNERHSLVGDTFGEIVRHFVEAHARNTRAPDRPGWGAAGQLRFMHHRRLLAADGTRGCSSNIPPSDYGVDAGTETAGVRDAHVAAVKPLVLVGTLGLGDQRAPTVKALQQGAKHDGEGCRGQRAVTLHIEKL